MELAYTGMIVAELHCVLFVGVGSYLQVACAVPLPVLVSTSDVWYITHVSIITRLCLMASPHTCRPTRV
jgi:hypothetical protein